MKIKAISLWQPWASALVLGVKKAETRHWLPMVNGRVYRGPLAIHAAKTDRDTKTGELLRVWFAQRVCSCWESHKAFNRAKMLEWEALPKGAVIGVCFLDTIRNARDCRPDPLEASWGDYTPSRYIWYPAGMTALPEPIPCVGRQALFDWDLPDELLTNDAIRSAIAEPRF